MAAAIGWYGPLIDLSKASSYIGDYVQLLVFIHNSTPVQYKNGGEMVRMDVLVGDESRSYFPVTIWQKQMGSQVLSGRVFLLQNSRFALVGAYTCIEFVCDLVFTSVFSFMGVLILILGCPRLLYRFCVLLPIILACTDLKITRFGDAVEARALHCSSLQCLLQPSDFAASNGLDELIEKCRVGITAKDKLQKVVGWLQRARLAHSGSVLNFYEDRRQLKVNWKVHEETRSRDCSSLSELLKCDSSCEATFYASIGEIFLPITWLNLREIESEMMFVSRRLHLLGENSLVDDLITNGCQLCGTPLNAGLGSDVEQNTVPLYCERSSDRLHVVGNVYRPFLLYVWDDLEYLPIKVTNKSAEILFGNISAEKVHSAYKSKLRKTVCHQSRAEDKRTKDGSLNLYKIWLIILKMLFKHGENSPLKFKVTVDTNRDWENGRLDMLSISLPAFSTR